MFRNNGTGLLDRGVISVETQMYAAADLAADRLEKTAAGTKVEIISILKDFTLIKQDGIYAYVPCRAVRIDVDYRKRYGEKTPSFSSEGVLLMEGNLYEDSKEQLMRAYRLIPENIRTAFEKNGFRIKMTEWDVAEEAYSPYGGYHGFGKVNAVMDYDLKRYNITHKAYLPFIRERINILKLYSYSYIIKTLLREIV